MVIERRLEDETPAIKLPEPEPEAEATEFDHSVPYPLAPEVEHGNVNQEHYRGARDPELTDEQRLPFPNQSWRGR
jgi:hypothetical protein